jgi:hypothetical protein
VLPLVSIVWFFVCKLTWVDNVICDIAKHLSELGAQLRRYFPKTDDTNNWICHPFHALPPVHLPISEQMSLIEIATSGSVKIELNQKPLPDFWIGLCSEYPALANHAVKTLMPLQPCTYVRVDSLPSLAWKLNTGTDCVKLFKTDSLQYNPTLQSYVRPFKHTLLINWWGVIHN